MPSGPELAKFEVCFKKFLGNLDVQMSLTLLLSYSAQNFRSFYRRIREKIYYSDFFNMKNCNFWRFYRFRQNFEVIEILNEFLNCEHPEKPKNFWTPWWPADIFSPKFQNHWNSEFSRAWNPRNASKFWLSWKCAELMKTQKTREKLFSPIFKNFWNSA